MFEVKINYYYVFTIKCELLDSSENFIVKIYRHIQYSRYFLDVKKLLILLSLNLAIDQNFTIFDIFVGKE